MIVHPIPAVYDSQSRILILGSFPSVKSRENNFFYGHPQNRFWSVLACVFGQSIPQTNDEKRAFLLHNRVALWDVIASCEIEGSSDARIRNAVPNDIAPILKSASIRAIYTNGKAADDLYRRFLEHRTGIKATRLPSTSPANAMWSLERLIEAWSVVRE